MAGLRTLACLVTATLTSFAPTAHYDVARDIKLGLDEGAKAIDHRPKPTTLEKLLASPRPAGMRPDGQRGTSFAKRIAPLETTIWELEVQVLRIEVRADQDYYLVIKGKSGRGTVAELPIPEQARGSRFYNKISEARKNLDDRFAPKGSKPIGRTARITGVGFYGQAKLTDKNDNGVRIQPLLSITWLK
jgi:hypothetical protein